MTSCSGETLAAFGTLTLNRPEKPNALTPDVFIALRRELDLIKADASVRCVILNGAGRSFCAGHDLGAIAAGDPGPQPNFEAETIDVLDALPIPTIAQLHGHCLTGGLELALACDILVCAQSTLLGDTHGKWGLVPIWGMSVRLPERVGTSTAKELMFTSRLVNGPTAAAIGLVDRCMPDDELNATVTTLADEIAANSPGSNRINKALLRAAMERNRTDALEFERTIPFGAPEDARERMERWSELDSAPLAGGHFSKCAERRHPTG